MTVGEMRKGNRKRVELGNEKSAGEAGDDFTAGSAALRGRTPT